MTANSKVRYAIDRWNRRMGAGLALGRTTPAHAPSAVRLFAAAAGAGGPPPVPAIRATLRRSRWASSRNQAPSPAALTVYSQPAQGATARVPATMTYE